VIPLTKRWKKDPYELVLCNLLSAGRALILCRYCSGNATPAKDMTTPGRHGFYKSSHAYWTIKYRFLRRWFR